MSYNPTVEDLIESYAMSGDGLDFKRAANERREAARALLEKLDPRKEGRTMSEETDRKVEELNRAFGSQTGDRPTFKAEHEGDEYLFGRRPVPKARAVDVVKALAALDEVGGDVEKLSGDHVDVLLRAAEEIRVRELEVRQEPSGQRIVDLGVGLREKRAPHYGGRDEDGM